MAKLLVGQYVLVNTIAIPDYNLNPKETIFIFIHFHKKYNPYSTEKNLNFISKKIFKNKSIPHYSLTFKDFKLLCENCNKEATNLRRDTL
jgi:uncharacterized protein YpiB (UPF0302 family)